MLGWASSNRTTQPDYTRCPDRTSLDLIDLGRVHVSSFVGYFDIGPSLVGSNG